MIIEYARPETVEETIRLLMRSEPKTIPLGGGTYLSQHSEGKVAVVDLQRLGWNQIIENSGTLEVGAMVTLQQLLESGMLPKAVVSALHHETGQNMRSQMTIAGSIVTSDGRSAFTTALLALNSRLRWIPEEGEVGLGDYLALRESWAGGLLIQSVLIPLNGILQMEWVARSPLDRPVLCVAVCRWPSGRTRVCLGGIGKSAILAMDGPEPAGADLAVRDAYLNASDAWASAEYRSTVGMEITRRLLANVEKE